MPFNSWITRGSQTSPVFDLPPMSSLPRPRRVGFGRIERRDMAPWRSASRSLGRLHLVEGSLAGSNLNSKGTHGLWRATGRHRWAYFVGIELGRQVLAAAWR